MQSDPPDRPEHTSLPTLVVPTRVGDVLPGERRVLAAAEQSLAGERRGLSKIWPFLGPAFIASVAYVDPGNFATNISAGARFGYLLLWVIFAANLMAMLIQAMSAKLGIATGRNLAQLARERFPRGIRIALWVQAEAVAMATDLAEFIGAALALNLLFDIAMLPAAGITAVVVLAILALQARGFRQLEVAIAGFVGMIVLGFAFQVVLADPDGGKVVHGLFTPAFDGVDSILLATGILGATVMPHVIYLHSALTQNRITGTTPEARRRIYRFELVDVVIAMVVAGAVNASMLVIAAATFHDAGLTAVTDLDEAYHQLGALLGSHADVIFGLALLASGISSSSVGTMAGQTVMEGFLDRTMPLLWRRLITMAPAFLIIAIGVDPSWALVLSQVVLSFGIPFALIPLIMFCRDRALMGDLVNRRSTTLLAVLVAILIITLNMLLLTQLLVA